MYHHQPVEQQSLLRSFDEEMDQSPRPGNDAAVDHDETKASASEVSVVLQGVTDPAYEGKARVLNQAIQEIGMGWYQWQLFVMVGFGWASDNLWPIVVSLILVPIGAEFKPRHLPLLSLCQAIGLLVGAMFWGFGCDIFGRRIAFNLTIAVTSLFGLVAASAPSFAAIGIFVTFWSVGVGGNLPVGESYRPQSVETPLDRCNRQCHFLGISTRHSSVLADSAVNILGLRPSDRDAGSLAPAWTPDMPKNRAELHTGKEFRMEVFYARHGRFGLDHVHRSLCLFYAVRIAQVSHGSGQR